MESSSRSEEEGSRESLPPPASASSSSTPLSPSRPDEASATTSAPPLPPDADLDAVLAAPTPAAPMSTSEATPSRPSSPQSATRQALARRLQPDVLQTLETLAALDGTTVEALVSEMELNVDQTREVDNHYTLEPLPVAGYPMQAVRNGISPTTALHFADVVAMPRPVRGVPVPQRKWTTCLGSGLCSMRGCHHVICPCMVFADLHTRVKYNTTNRGPDECTLCMHFAMLWPGIPIVLSSILSFVFFPAAVAVWAPMHAYASWFSSPTRTRLRIKYAIERTRVPLLGCPVSDNCVHMWCMACSLLQEGNELDRGVLPTWNELHGGRTAAGGSAPQPEPRRPGPSRLIPRGQEARLNSTQVIFR